MLQVCNDLKLYNNSDKTIGMVKRDEKAQGSISCFMYDMQVWIHVYVCVCACIYMLQCKSQG